MSIGPVRRSPAISGVVLHMGPDPGVGRQAINAWLADRVGALDPGPLIQRRGLCCSCVGCGIEGELPKVPGRAISCGIESLSAKEPEVSMGVAPSGGEPP